MSVDHQRLNLTNRERYLRLLPEHLSDVDGGKRSVVGKIQSLFIASLTVEQSCELVTITETELDLEPCPVNVIYIFAADRGIGREIQSESATGQIIGETGACWDSMGGIKQCRNLHFRAGRQD